jgi:hypothetical protein
MTKRIRPYIPLAVRVAVAHRQLAASGIWTSAHLAAMRNSPAPLGFQLLRALTMLFGTEPGTPHLDHNPALRTRTFNPRTGRYTPDANDADYLIYRTAAEHRIKTLVRGDGAQHPDRVLINKERRRGKPKRKGPKIKSRSNWPSGRKIRGRNTWKRKSAARTVMDA